MDLLLSCPLASSSDLEGWQGLWGQALSNRLGTGLRSGVQRLGGQDQAGACVCVCVVLGLGGKESPPRPPESPGSFPVTAGSAARAIFNSHSRLCSQQSSLGSRGRGSLLLPGAKALGTEALT